MSRFQVMFDYLCFIAPIYHCVELSLVDETFLWKLLSFHLKWLQLNSFGETCFIEESYEKMQKLQNFDNFESTLYSKSGSMPLNLGPFFFN